MQFATEGRCETEGEAHKTVIRLAMLYYNEATSKRTKVEDGTANVRE